MPALTPVQDQQLLLVAAWWHDLGIRPGPAGLRDSGCHQIDGARRAGRWSCRRSVRLKLGVVHVDLAVAVSIVAIFFTFVNFAVTAFLTIRRDITAIRPVLAFTYMSEGWHIENLGNGPALDVVFHRLKGGAATQNVRLPPLAKGATFCLHFARRDSKQTFAATYRDANNRKYFSRSQHDLSTSGKGFGKIERAFDLETLPRWWRLPDSEPLLDRRKAGWRWRRRDWT